MDLPLLPPVRPMLARAAATLPDGEGWLYEPKWDGFRCLVFRDHDELVLTSRNERPLTRYFPELLEPLHQVLPFKCVLDGEIVIAGHGGLDFDALQQRIHPAESRINRLAGEIPASFVAFDLLAFDDHSLLERPLRERRALLERLLADAAPPVHLTPATTDLAVANDWFTRFEGAGLDGVVAKPLDGTYQPGKRVLVKVKHARTADCVLAGFRMHKDGEGVGSLLLGLYDEGGTLHHVGVATSFTAKRRRELVDELAALRAGALDDHPWASWAAPDPGSGRLPGAVSRWNATKDLGWEPVRIERVVEVAYDQLQRDRFRHATRFVRWRPDREPSSCRYDQLEAIAPAELHELFGA